MIMLIGFQCSQRLRVQLLRVTVLRSQMKEEVALPAERERERETVRDTQCFFSDANCFHMSGGHTASADSVIKLGGDEWRGKKGSGCTDL